MSSPLPWKMNNEAHEKKIKKRDKQNNDFFSEGKCEEHMKLSRTDRTLVKETCSTLERNHGEAQFVKPVLGLYCPKRSVTSYTYSEANRKRKHIGSTSDENKYTTQFLKLDDQNGGLYWKWTSLNASS